MLQDRCPDISGAYAVDVLTEMKLAAVMEDEVEEELRGDSGMLVMENGFETTLHHGTP